MKTYQKRAVYLVADYQGRTPILFRKNTGFLDNHWCLIAGRAKNKENLKEAMIREAKEEADLKLKTTDLELIHICERLQIYKEKNLQTYWLDAYFYAKNLKDKPINNEPKKHSEIKMCALKNLPKNTLPYIKSALKAYLNNKNHSTYGF